MRKKKGEDVKKKTPLTAHPLIVIRKLIKLRKSTLNFHRSPAHPLNVYLLLPYRGIEGGLTLIL